MIIRYAQMYGIIASRACPSHKFLVFYHLISYLYY